MGKEKFTLDELKVQSFVTSLDPAAMQEVKGGYMVVRGRRVGYRARWTSVDTRAGSNFATSRPPAGETNMD